MSTTLVIDGPSVYARAWYATSKDFPDEVATIRSALQTTFSLLNVDVDRIGERIDRLLFCWDGDHGRDKGKRLLRPAAFYDCREVFKQKLTEMIGAVHATPPRHEADDAIATAVSASKSQVIFVASGDKDLMQLQSSRVRYYCLNNNVLLSRATVLTKFGVKHPRQISIAQAILGDKVDNIPGIHGWGLAKVKKLFATVTPEHSFSQALSIVEKQIPEEFQEAFWASLDRTLLDSTLKGLPEAAPLSFAPVEDVINGDIPGIEDSYSRMVASYSPSKGRAAAYGAMDENDEDY